MAVRGILAATLLLIVATGCGGDATERQEVRLLAPADLAADVARFERRTGCRVDLRVYDDGEDIAVIAKRRDVDVVAKRVPPGAVAHDSVELVRVELEPGLEVTVPKALASAFHGTVRPAGVRRTRWTLRNEGESADCAERWLDYATSQ
jgi:hypothetical protein